MNEHRNTILAIALSIAVLITWQVFVGIPQMREQQARQAELAAQSESAGTDQSAVPQPDATGTPTPQATTPGVAPTVPGGAVTATASRQAALAATSRIAIEAPDLAGSLNLQGARIDDLSLTQYRETVEPDSPIITLLSPSGSPNPYYIEAGWTVAPGTEVAVPTSETVWTAESNAALTPGSPVTLTYDNGAGLVFKRTIAIDDHYMFAITQSVENTTGAAVTLYPYGLISRHGTPATTNFYILHEGLIGVLGEDGLREIDYDEVAEDGPQTIASTGGWLGITDKYWATALIPAQDQPFNARFSANTRAPTISYQTDYLLDPVTVAPGASVSVETNVFAGAKRVRLIESYEENLGIKQFDLMIDWGWFYFLTRPMFTVLDYFNAMIGNFGIAILIVTVLIKLIFFPLANKSYVSMSRMKLVQPEMQKIRDNFADDKQRQQQEMMKLYKEKKINPLSGCLPILVQIPVFFALYKVLFVTIEMRHAPFFGWIRDLSAPDPTSLFNLFGLIPLDLPAFLMIGVWPIIMGLTMFIQMKLNPAPPDPTQQLIFNWMPLVFTFILAGFPAGLVIYWAWNNFLSILQQYIIMRRQGVKVELWDNIKSTFQRKAAADNTADKT